MSKTTKGHVTTSFNLTACGRAILRDLADDFSIGQGKALTMLINQADSSPINLPLVTGKKGGRPSVYFGKDRGTTTCVELKLDVRKELDNQVKVSGLTRGDYVEYLLRDHEDKFNELVKTFIA